MPFLDPLYLPTQNDHKHQRSSTLIAHFQVQPHYNGMSSFLQPLIFTPSYQPVNRPPEAHTSQTQAHETPDRRTTNELQKGTNEEEF